MSTNRKAYSIGKYDTNISQVPINQDFNQNPPKGSQVISDDDLQFLVSNVLDNNQ